ncbi:galactosylceramide sulfotransferase-like [Ptychodera flava]|uniref:galactosylceramide sulfotransferase-like n=1 Tax=Ptychodera flava TaxID=63121 RepID=UPI003969CBB4
MAVTKRKTFLSVTVTSLFVTALYIARLHSSASKLDTQLGQFVSKTFRNSSIMHGKSKLPCKEVTQVVFIKTHKTASSTMNSVVQRFGYNRSLAFALPKDGHIFDETQLFARELLQYQRPPSNQRTHFNIIASHLRYNRPELDKVVPDATYITIIRNPVQRFESAFGYNNYASKLKLTESKNPLEEFMKKPDEYVKRITNVRRDLLRNGMSFSLGFDHRFDDSDSAINEMIDKLDKELDLVLISDYFEESLVLLKNVLCWKFDDILYISKRIRSENRRYMIPKSVADRILKWNKADVKLYEHFNYTFWKKVNIYGANFYKELQEYRTRFQQFNEECVDANHTKILEDREEAIIMRAKSSIQCRLAFTRTAPFHNILRNVAAESYNISAKNVTEYR